MSTTSDTRSTTLGPLGLLRKHGESAAVGKVAIGTDQGGWPIVWTGGSGCPIGKPPSRPLGEDAKGARAGCPLPKTPWEVCEAKEKGADGAGLHCQTTAQSTA